MVKTRKKESGYWVTMTDKFMSGWGKAQGKTNKLVIKTDTYEEAKTVERNAKDRSEMIYVNIRSTKPHYDPKHYLTSLRTKSDTGYWFKKDRPWRK